ncbi:MAG: threonine synthase [Rhodobiaceae bacterium]|nr:threonine synthase [Rhodobiaceae bacterium]
MNYISTRGNAKKLNFEGVLLKGLADDGGLYIPESTPVMSADEINSLSKKTYQEIAFHIIKKFTGETFPDSVLNEMIFESYKNFTSKSIAPLVEYEKDKYIMELFHGPTLAFKDIAMQLISRMLNFILTKRNIDSTIICATSGDTGGAAVDAFSSNNRVKLFVLLPDGRVSDVQRRMMTTVKSKNIKILSIDGNFDDCQNIVKNLFNDHDFSKNVNLSGVNSINWARIMVQCVYYFTAFSFIEDKDIPINFIVPTGNFGDIYAGYLAKSMGLPISKLIIATNINDILKRCIDSGIYEISDVIPSNSPSMDIQISSNFERLLFDLEGKDPLKVRKCMTLLSDNGKFKLSKNAHSQLKEMFDADALDIAETLKTIKHVYLKYNIIIDPHTAVGFGVSLKKPNLPVVTLSTAHPAKFPETVFEAIGKYPALPKKHKNLHSLSENIQCMPNNAQKIKDYIVSQ